MTYFGTSQNDFIFCRTGHACTVFNEFDTIVVCESRSNPTINKGMRMVQGALYTRA